MKRAKRGISNFARTRQALLACFLGLGFAMLWPGAAQGWTQYLRGPAALINSATDDGGGRIRVSWSLEPVPANSVYDNAHPHKVCVLWGVVENGVEGSSTNTCFTSETSNQANLLVDTGIGADGARTVFYVYLFAYYNDVRVYADNERQRLEVTLNATTS
ncbi:MAG: hypothetical protein OXQ29_23490 [Rhodospirillaceae bacterium]|nr:hypothetical protein [Rhodospirillaceae bacterium]